MNFAEKVDILPENIKTYFISNTPRIEFEAICFLYKIDSEKLGAVAMPIGLIFVREKQLSNLPNIIKAGFNAPANISYGIAYETNKRIFNKFPEYFKNSMALLEQWSNLKSPPFLSEDEAYKKVLEIEPWILENEKEEALAAKKEKREISETQAILSFAQALKNFSNFGEQLITSEKISLHNFPEPVRPSIKNWIADYTFSTGHDKRSAMERSIYIFQSPNGKRLTPSDRQKLAYVLKAYDESLPITINKNSQQIVFNASPAEARPAVAQNTEAGASMSFSYPQKLPYERKDIAPNIIRTEEKPKPLPKNVVNLKE